MNTAGNLVPAIEPVTQMQTVGVIVARSGVGPGRTDKPDDLPLLRARPSANAGGAFIRANEYPDAIQTNGSIAAAPFMTAIPPVAMPGKNASARFAIPGPTTTQM